MDRKGGGSRDGVARFLLEGREREDVNSLVSSGSAGRARSRGFRRDFDLWDCWIGRLTLDPPSLLCDAVKDDVAREPPPGVVTAYCWKAPPEPGPPFDASTLVAMMAESMNSVDGRRVQITAVQSEPARGLRRRTPRLSRRRPGSARGRTFTVSRATIRSTLVFAPLARTRCRAGAYALTPRADPSAREPGRLRTGETRVAAFESTRPDTAGGEARLSEVTLRPLKISKGRNVVSHGESRIPTVF